MGDPQAEQQPQVSTGYAPLWLPNEVQDLFDGERAAWRALTCA
jgi:hypothetical protein